MLASHGIVSAKSVEGGGEMPQSVGEVEAHFRDRGLTLTPQRRAIVRYLINRGGHPTSRFRVVAEGICSDCA